MDTPAALTHPLGHATDAAKPEDKPHQTENWAHQVAADIYQSAKSAVQNPYVEGTGVVVAAAIGLAVLHKPAAAGVIRDVLSGATTNLEERSALSSPSIITTAKPEFHYAKSMLRPASDFRSLLNWDHAPGENPLVSRESVADRVAKLADTWTGKDGAAYKFKPAEVTNSSWHHIFESEFPPEERQPYDFLTSLAHKDAVPRVSLQLTERNGSTAAFSMLSDYGESSEGRKLLLPYIGVERPLQNMGVGSEHLQRLLTETRAKFPTARGMAVEIEDPHAPGLTADDITQRMRRVDWYVGRHGAELLDRKYLIPSAEEGAEPLPGKLLWMDFNRGGATEDALHRLISSIYKHGYELEADHPVVKQVLGKYS